MGTMSARVLSVLCGFGLAAGAPAAFAASTGDFLAEAGVGALCGCGAAGAGFGLYFLGTETTSDNDDNEALMAAGGILMVTSPAAMAGGVYLMGEDLDGPSANKFAAWALPTLAAYGSSVVITYVAGVAGAGYVGAIVGAAAMPFLTAWAYNAVKKPAPAGESRLPSLEPYVAAAAGGNGRPVPLYGLTFSF